MRSSIARPQALRPASAAAIRATRPAAPQRPRGRAAAAAADARAAEGDFVAVRYTGTLDDGEVFDSNRDEGRGLLEFQVGGGRVIKGFDKAVTGLAVGEGRKVRVAPEEAYGERSDEAVIQVPADRAPKGLQAGDRVTVSGGMSASVVSVDDKNVTIDLNHELAGKHLTFDVELVSLAPAARLQSVVFGAGCFWGPQLAFDRVPGVIATEVGYSQGTVKAPTYDQVCSGTTGHTEVVKVTYDPAEVTFEQLLDAFWDRHDPTSKDRQGNDSGTQYRAGVYTTGPEQAEVAQRYFDAKRAAMPGVKIWTELEPMREYYPAEDYHQKYLERGGRFGRPQSAEKKCTDPIRCYG